MGNTCPLGCSWLLIDGVKKILDESEHTAGSINKALQYIKETLGVSGASIHRIISRPYSLRIIYEHIDSAMSRINQTITYSRQEWNQAVEEYKKGYYHYDSEEGPSFLHGVSTQDTTTSVIQLPFFSDEQLTGTLNLIDSECHRVLDEREVTILFALRDLIFEELTRIETENSSSSDEGYRDYITNLSRYENFVENLDQILPEFVTDDNAVMIVYADIYHFKLINETYGYRKGDELLRAFAEQLKKGEPYIDACRIYSDNFIVAYSIPKSSVSGAKGRMESLHEFLGHELKRCCPDSNIRICSGIYIMQDTEIDAATAIAYANMARKYSKQQNNGDCIVFAPSMMQDMKWHSYLNNQLPRAIENHDLVVYYHPKISCDSNRLLGAEALVRWKRKDGSFIYPDQFIPEFEKNGNIVKLDYYVYEEVFRYISSRIKKDLPVVPVSMNVSRAHLENDNILAYIQLLLQKYRIPTKYIEFELTENIYMKNFESARNFVATCNTMGICVSMDDFGSGYSSLNMLSDLKIDILKIDKIFMRHADLNENDCIILRSVIDMAKQLNLIVLCEGVETETQVDFLKEAGCDIIQGYYYARPMNQEEFDDFIIMDYLNN